jgi:RNA polymerase sigma-70 factor, ECF subfamily
MARSFKHAPPADPPPPSDPYIDPDSEVYAGFVDLVARIRSGQTEGITELYEIFVTGIRFYLCRQLGAQELEDKVHDTFLTVLQAIQRGEVREPERLMGFVRTVVRRHVAAHIEKMMTVRRDHTGLDPNIRVADPHDNPEEKAVRHQRLTLIGQVLDELGEKDREVLKRFYLYEQSQDQICKEMELTETQFRLLKSRAKARFGELGKKKLANKQNANIAMRISASTSH